MNEIQVLQEKVNHLALQLASQEKSILDDSLFSPDKADHYQKLATQLSKSSLVPKAIQGKPVDVFLVMATAHKLKVSIEAGLQGIGVINGKPVVYGDLLLAIVRNHPEFVDIIEEPIYKGDKIFAYKCEVKRKNQTASKSTFSLDDAKKAGLLGKSGPWQSYESRMLQMRARAFACRDAFADALCGVASAEEMGDVIDGEYYETPKRRIDEMKSQLKGDKDGTDNQNFDASVDKPEVEDVKEETSKNGHNEPMAGDGAGEVEVVSQDQKGSLISPEQVKQLDELIEEINMDDERLEKALAYYEVNKFTELTSKKADHFIAKLLKERNVK